MTATETVEVTETETEQLMDVDEHERTPVKGDLNTALIETPVIQVRQSIDYTYIGGTSDIV